METGARERCPVCGAPHAGDLDVCLECGSALEALEEVTVETQTTTTTTTKTRTRIRARKGSKIQVNVGHAPGATEVAPEPVPVAQRPAPAPTPAPTPAPRTHEPWVWENEQEAGEPVEGQREPALTVEDVLNWVCDNSPALCAVPFFFLTLALTGVTPSRILLAVGVTFSVLGVFRTIGFRGPWELELMRLAVWPLLTAHDFLCWCEVPPGLSAAIVVLPTALMLEITIKSRTNFKMAACSTLAMFVVGIFMTDLSAGVWMSFPLETTTDLPGWAVGVLSWPEVGGNTVLIVLPWEPPLANLPRDASEFWACFGEVWHQARDLASGDPFGLPKRGALLATAPLGALMTRCPREELARKAVDMVVEATKVDLCELGRRQAGDLLAMIEEFERK